ncbi:MAG: spermidine/putrescine ABC transporter permease PotC [Coxiella sp. RIFCSPHIGHO2_12_FULL_44_14]|nr:MAG: spermidine/putrescine ABC transporter permease PotC [Coxiella sp. RIFCSPHIGHO2_12_FULL_44_14]
MNRPLTTTYLILVYLFLYLPIAVVVVFSFNHAAHSMLWHGFTLHWYRVLFHDAALAEVTLHSIEIAVLAATGASALGTLAAVSLFRYRFLGKRLLDGLLATLIIIPDIVTGIALLLLFRFSDVPLGFWSLLLAHITFCIPFVFVTVSARLSAMDHNLIEAARDLGAKEHIIFFRILVPLLWPALLTGWLLSLTLSLDDVIISYFVTGPSFDILPLKIYSMVKLGVDPEINALCTLLLGLTLILVIIAQTLLRKKQ